MRITLLLLSLILLLVAMLLSMVPLLVVSAVSVMVLLASLKLDSGALLFSFWLWMNLVLLYLWSQPVDSNPQQLLVLGLPVPAFWMLLGVWIIPVLIWPLGFALTFGKWSQR